MEEKAFTREEAIKEAKRCISCQDPLCRRGCPLRNNIPDFIQGIKEDNLDIAYKTLLETTILSEVCGRICPQYKQCSGSCILGQGNKRPVAIGRLEQYVADEMHKDDKYLYYMEKIKEKIDKKYQGKRRKVAVVGTGPSSIACAYELVLNGFAVTMFEKEKVPGGILTYGISEFRLPNEVVQKVIYKLMKLGVEIRYGVEFGEDIYAEDLTKEGFEAIFLGIGLNKSRELELDGKNLKNVCLAKEFLYATNREDGEFFDINPRFVKDKDVVIIGGGNVALDCARIAVRKEAKSVKIVYRRTEEELLVSKVDRKVAEDEGITFEYLTLPIKFLGHHRVEKIECVKMAMGEQDDSGRRKPMILIGSNYEIKADYVIVCVGNKPDENSIDDIKNLVVDDEYKVIVNDDGQTSVPYIFAGGDICTLNSQTVAFAADSGRTAAKGIVKYLTKEKNKTKKK